MEDDRKFVEQLLERMSNSSFWKVSDDTGSPGCPSYSWDFVNGLDVDECQESPDVIIRRFLREGGEVK